MKRQEAGGLCRTLRDERGGAAVVVLLLVAIVLAVAAAMGFQKAKRKEAEVQSLHERIAQQEKGKPAPAPVKTDDEKLVREVSARAKDVEQKAGELGASLAAAERKLQSLQQDRDKLAAEKAAAEAETREQAAAVQRLERMMKTEADAAAKARNELRAAKDALAAKTKEAGALAGKLDAAEGAVEDMKAQVTRIQRDADVLATKLVQEIESGERKIQELTERLSEYPTEQLPENAAKEKYDRIVAAGQNLESRDDRVSLYFQGAMVLSGTSYEAKLKQMLAAEKKAQQADREKKASDDYKSAQAMTRETPDAYEENIAFLKEALESGRGTKMEKSLQKLLEQQEKAKAAAEKKAAEEAAKAAEEAAKAAETAAQPE